MRKGMIRKVEIRKEKYKDHTFGVMRSLLVILEVSFLEEVSHKMCFCEAANRSTKCCVFLMHNGFPKGEKYQQLHNNEVSSLAPNGHHHSRESLNYDLEHLKFPSQS